MKTQDTNEIRELTTAEAQLVSGGMKWERGHVSPNVIDDVHGKISSYTPN
jgi:hypothetical protein